MKRIHLILTSLIVISGAASFAANAPQGTIPNDNMHAVSVIYIQNEDGTYQAINENRILPVKETPKIIAKTASQGLSQGALSYTTDFNQTVQVIAITLRASSPISETLAIKLQNQAGEDYSAILTSANLKDNQNYFYQPDGALILRQGDEITVTCSNANLTGSVYLTVLGRIW